MRNRDSKSLADMAERGDLGAPFAGLELLERERPVGAGAHRALAIAEDEQDECVIDGTAAHGIAHDAREALVMRPAQRRYDARFCDDEPTVRGCDLAFFARHFSRRCRSAQPAPWLIACGEESTRRERSRDESDDRVRDRHRLRRENADDLGSRATRFDERLAGIGLHLHAELTLAEDLGFDLEAVTPV